MRILLRVCQKVERNTGGLLCLTIGVVSLLLPLWSSAATPKPKFPWKQFAIGAGMQMAAGWLDNEADVLKFNYHLYERRWPDADPRWANPKVSAVNKYRDWPHDTRAAYPGSKTWLVWTTDKYHLNRFVPNGLMAGSLAVQINIGEKLRWKQVALMALGNWAAFALGSGASSWFYGMGRE